MTAAELASQDMSDFDSQEFTFEARPPRLSSALASDLLFGDMHQTVTANGTVIVRPTITPSPYMQAVLDKLAVPGPNIVVKATAGGGKTTLLEMISNQMIELGQLGNGLAAFLAFNKHVVKELRSRLPLEFDVRTINSLGHLIVQEHCPQIPFKPGKYEGIIRELIANRKFSRAAAKDYQERTEKALEMTVNNLLEPGTDFDTWRSVMTMFDLSVPEDDRDLYGLTFEALRRGQELLVHASERDSDDQAEWVMSFLDQVYAPYANGWKLANPYSFLLIDEAQDLSLGQTALIEASITPDARLVAVGDSSQSIYGTLQGTLADSLDTLAFAFQAEIMPLSVSYRLPSRHVALASEYTDTIEAAPGAIGGILADITEDQMPGLVRSSSMVICRTNAPLVRHAFLLNRAGVRCHIRGLDVSRQLVRMFREVVTWKDGRGHLQDYRDDLPLERESLLARMREHLKQTKAALRRSVEGTDRSVELELAMADDKMLAIKAVVDEQLPGTAGELVELLRGLFAEKNGGATLCTAHKAKGLEADVVFIIEPHLMPHPRAESEQALLVERATKFVALTRGKRALYIVGAQPPMVPEALVCWDEAG